MPVLALRKASAPFLGPAHARSETFVRLVRDWEAIQTQLDALRRRLADEMYEQIGGESNDTRRRALLQTKRDVYNGRPLSVDRSSLEPDDAFPPSLERDLTTYSRLLRESDARLSEAETVVPGEINTLLAQHLQDPTVASALYYSSPALFQNLIGDGDSTDGDSINATGVPQSPAHTNGLGGDGHRHGAPGVPAANARTPRTGPFQSVTETPTHAVAAPAAPGSDIRLTYPVDPASWSDKQRVSLYRYAVKFATKANPLHAFASVSLPGIDAPTHRPFAYELNVRSLLRLERQVAEQIPGQRFVDLAPCITSDTHHTIFPVVHGTMARRAALTRTSFLDRIVELLRSSAPIRYTALVDALQDTFQASSTSVRSHIAQSLNRLIDAGVLNTYVFETLDRPVSDATAETIQHVADAPDADVTNADVPVSAIARQVVTHRTWVEHPPLPPAAPTDASSPHVPHYITSFDDAINADAVAERCADALSTLQRLKPVLTLHHDAVRRSFAIDRILEDIADERGQDAVPYLDAVAACLRRPRLISERAKHYVTSERGAAVRHMLQTVRSEAEQEDVSPARLQSWTDEIHRQGLAAPTSLCVNGPVDMETGVFYVSNLWDGYGRFTSRFRTRSQDPLTALDAPHRPGDAIPDGHRPLQVYDVLGLNLHDTQPPFDTGTGLDPRYRHRFEHWIRPEQLQFVRRGDAFNLCTDPDAAPYTVRYVGCGLLMQFPVAYQLLTRDQPDIYLNPFVSSLSVPTDIEYDPGQTIGAVCLRRPEWRIPVQALPQPDPHASSTRTTLRLREWLQSEVSSDLLPHAYYRVDPAGTRSKPRYVDFAHPLSVLGLLRDVQAADEDAVLRLSPMQPGPEGLLPGNQGRHVAEVMLHV